MPALLLGVLVFVSKRKEKREGLCAPPKRKKRHTTTPPPLQKPHHDHQVKGPNGTLHAFYNKKRRKGGAGGEAILIGRWEPLTQVWVGCVTPQIPLASPTGPQPAIAVLAMQHCPTCIGYTAAFVYCMHCAAPLRTATVSDAARASHAATITRFDELMEAGRKTATLAGHKAAWASFSSFMLTIYQAPAIQATPMHVVAWLMSKDKGGHTVVHCGACARYRVPASSPLPACSAPTRCTKRLKAAAVKTKAMALRAYFRDAGHAAPWNGVSGNPANSPFVTHFLQGTKKEQLAAGIVPKLAPMFDEVVYHTMCEHLVATAGRHMAKAAMLEAYCAMQDALALALLFCCPDRSVDVGGIRHGDLELITVPGILPLPLARAEAGAGAPSGPGGMSSTRQALRLHLGLSKPSMAGGHGENVQARTVILPEAGQGAGTASSPVTLYRALAALRVHSDIRAAPEPADYVLLARSCLITRKGEAVKPGAVPQVHLGYTAMREVMTRALDAQGLGATPITVHSFRASGARAAILRGDPIEDILYAFNWTDVSMLSYYTELRALYTSKDRRAPRDGEVAPLALPA